MPAKAAKAAKPPAPLSLTLCFFSRENLENVCAKAENKNVSAAFCRLCGARPNFPSAGSRF